MDAQRVTIDPDKVNDPAATPNPAVVMTGEGSTQVLVGEDGKPITEAPKGERPEWLPEGMADGAALRKSYDELRTKMSQGKPPETLSDTPAPTPKLTEEKTADLTAALAEVATSGEVSAETYAALTAKGITKDTVDTYIEGQKALAKQNRTVLAEVAGGDEGLTNVLTWAKATLSAEEKSAYDAALNSGSMGLLRLALEGVVAKYKAANPAEPTLVKGQNIPGGAGAKPYASNAEMVADMKLPKYKTDPAFRREVAARVAVS